VVLLDKQGNEKERKYMTAQSQQFEQAARTIFQQLRHQFGYENVLPSQSYPAKDSGISRQIDVTAYRTDGGQILIECKCHTHPVDIAYVDAFHTVIHTDIGADGGMLVSASGFTHGAIKSAQAKQIALATLNAGATAENYTLQLANLMCIGITETNPIREEVVALSIPVENVPEQQ